MPLLRLRHSSDAVLHLVEITVETPGMAPRTAIARFAFPMTQADHELISWYFEMYRNDPAEPGAGRPAARAELEIRA